MTKIHLDRTGRSRPALLRHRQKSRTSTRTRARGQRLESRVQIQFAERPAAAKESATSHVLAEAEGSGSRQRPGKTQYARATAPHHLR
eukprot:scaffold12548_cov128-Isochrysis_galbana.AAC.3